MQIWAVDISQWPEEQSSKEALDPLLRQFFSHDADQENTTQKVTRYVRGVDRIRESRRYEGVCEDAVLSHNNQDSQGPSRHFSSHV